MAFLADSITTLSEELSCGGDDVITQDPSVMSQIPAVLEDTTARLRNSSSRTLLLEARALAVELLSLARIHGTAKQRSDLAQTIRQLDNSLQTNKPD
jgi:hypothetical protein